MPWELIDWNQDRKEEHAKRVAETNKAWGEKNERERREKIANALGFEKEKSKMNSSEASTSKSQSSNRKSQKM